MSHVYADYTRARIGFFFGLTGAQLALVAVTALPAMWTVGAGEWAATALLATGWVLLTVLIVTPIRGRSATGWLTAVAAHTTGSVTGWSRYRSRAAAGAVTDPDQVDLPGVLSGIEVHDAPPAGPHHRRVALIQNHATRTWAVTAAVTHPGIGLSEPADRDRYGAGLATLLDAASRTALIDEVIIVVRTVPDDGAERAHWLARHRHPDTPAAVRAITDDLATFLSGASVRTEAFVTVVVPESRLAKPAKEAGGGIEGRALVVHGLLGEVETHLRGGLGMSSVDWLTSPELAAACRTGFAPGDRAGLVDAATAGAADVPWSMAGPSGAQSAVRHYRHDAWASISLTLTLPVRGAVIGALAPVLVPAAGERRSVMVSYPVLSARAADRHTATTAWSADMADGLRTKAKVRQRTASREESDKARGLDAKVAHGHALTRPHAICTVTVPATAPVADHGRRLDAAVRSAGYAPLRLDLSQDAAFACAAIPLGVSLTRRGTS